jgi:hypothetical protein
MAGFFMLLLFLVGSAGFDTISIKLIQSRRTSSGISDENDPACLVSGVSRTGLGMEAEARGDRRRHSVVVRRRILMWAAAVGRLLGVNPQIWTGLDQPQRFLWPPFGGLLAVAGVAGQRVHRQSGVAEDSQAISPYFPLQTNAATVDVPGLNLLPGKGVEICRPLWLGSN